MNRWTQTAASAWAFVRRFEARVLVGLILAAGALRAFLNLGGEMAEGETDSFDRRLILLLRTPGDLNNPVGPKSVEEAVRDVTALGGTTLVSLLTVVAVLMFLFHKKRRHALVMGASVLLAWVSSELTKDLYHR